MSIAQLSLRSRVRLASCHPDLRRVVQYAEAWMPFDFTVLEGQRTRARQQRLFAQGRAFEHGQWVVADPDRVVTQCDGVAIRSKHQGEPSQAIKLAPWPLDLADRDRFHVMAGVVLAAAAYLRIRMRWGTEDVPGEAVLTHPLIAMAHFQLNRDTY